MPWKHIYSNTKRTEENLALLQVNTTAYKLLYYEKPSNVEHALEREKEIKLMGREAKEIMIKTIHLKFSFLYIAN